MTRKINVVDTRTPVEEVDAPLSTRITRGAFIAYNGPSDDGERTRAIVLNVDDDASSITVLNGVTEYTIEGDDVKDVTLLAPSADKYAQRVSTKARALGRTHNWCEVANDAVRELNAGEELDKPPVFDLKVTTVSFYRVRPTTHALTEMRDGNVTEALTNSSRWSFSSGGVEPRYHYLQVLKQDQVATLQVELIDEYPTDLHNDDSGGDY